MSEAAQEGTALPPGTRLGPYVLVSQLGAGGMGVVYRARDERLGRDVALKLLPAAFRNPDRLRRFSTEARAAAALSHPNVLAVFDVSTDGEHPYLVTELLEGRTLSELLADGPPPLKRALALAAQAARGLAAAHERGIIHRDLKPSNLFVTRDGTLKILDFGLAKVIQPPAAAFDATAAAAAPTGEAHTAEGAIMGTVGFMAPEQVQGKPADARSDLFAFGCVLHELLSGTRAFAGPTPVEVSVRILRDEPRPLPDSVPPAVARVVARCLAKAPEERFQSARDLAFVLDDLATTAAPSTASGVTVPASGAPAVAAPPSGPPTVPTAPAAPARRRALLLLAVVALSGLAYVVGRKQASPRGHAETPRPAQLPHFTPLTFRLGQVTRARFAPQGGVVYSFALEGHARIFLAQPGNAEARQVVEGDADLLSVSRDGELAIALHPTPDRNVLARAPLAGGTPRELLEDVASAEWSADGTELLAVHRVDGKIRIEYPIGKVVLESDAQRVLARPSPRGDAIALVEYRVPSYSTARIELVTLDGKRRALTETYGSLNSMLWTPDGSELWFTAGTERGFGRTVYAATLDGKIRTVTELPNDVSLADRDETGRTLLTMQTFHHRIAGVTPGAAHERDLSWFEESDTPLLSPDGTRLASTVFGSAVRDQSMAYLRDTRRPDAVALGHGTALALSPDGKWLLVGSGPDHSDLELLPTGAGIKRPLPRGGLEIVSAAFWFPDGQRLLVVAKEKGRRPRVWTVAADGQSPPQPLSDEGVVATSGPSPDGAILPLLGPDRRLQLLTVATRALRPLDKLPAGWAATGWSTDGKTLFVRDLGGIQRLDGYVSTDIPVRIARFDLQRGTLTPWRELRPGEPWGWGHVDNVVVANDGASYAYAYAALSSTLYLVEGLR